jgi:hypothetical protein
LRGQAEKPHLRLNDLSAVYTFIMVIGTGEPWNTSQNQGSLFLPTLGLIVPMTMVAPLEYTLRSQPLLSTYTKC